MSGSGRMEILEPVVPALELLMMMLLLLLVVVVAVVAAADVVVVVVVGKTYLSIQANDGVAKTAF